jgi:hypothetical protein
MNLDPARVHLAIQRARRRLVVGGERETAERPLDPPDERFQSSFLPTPLSAAGGFKP